MVFGDIVHWFFPFVFYQLAVMIYIVSLCGIFSFVSIIMQNFGYCRTVKLLSILRFDSFLIQVSGNLADTVASACHLKDFLHQRGIFS